ncbi:RPR domain containing protein [Cryptosporidium ryanae]|uniref:RPR domain containing protein n=1 Tax=Cryptosporidium ryanae TaxID=515981 RepID=UPI00351AA905|nr:RPR domain containing protein [Cryptosporidium ryanae]
MSESLANVFLDWLNKSLEDPLSWVWQGIDKVKDISHSSDEFTEVYKKYLIKNKYDNYEITKYDFTSPIESLYRDLKSQEMPIQIKDQFQTLINELSLKRKNILNIMKFVVDYSDLHSAHMIEMLIKVFPFSNNIIKKSVIYCLSDILYNSHSSISGAWKLRNCMMNLFPYLVSHISYHSSIGNSSYSELVQVTENILRIWLDWDIFPKPYIKGVFSTLYFDKKYELRSESSGKISIISKSPKLDGKLLEKEILSIISIWPIRSRKPTFKFWFEIKNLMNTNCFNEHKLRQDWIINNGIIVPPIITHGISNFLHRISYLEVFEDNID